MKKITRILIFTFLFMSMLSGMNADLQWEVKKAYATGEAPTFISGYPSVANVTSDSLDLQLKLNESGTVYYKVYPQGSDAPSSVELKESGTAKGVMETFVSKWGSFGSGNGQLKSPREVAVDENGNIFVVEYYNYRVQKFDNKGGYITKWGSSGSGSGQFTRPTGVAVDGNGNVFVVDSSNYRIQKFDNNGGYITQWGNKGSESGQFGYPSGVAVDGNGNVYVSDVGNNHCIKKFDNNGEYITQWGNKGSGSGQFSYPNGVAVDGNGNVFVVDSSNYRIQKFDNNGGYITQWGNEGSECGQFNYPKGIAVDGDGCIYVADSHNNRIQKFDNNGGYITQWGSEGSGNGQFSSYVYGIAVDSNSNIFVTDANNACIQKFGFEATVNINSGLSEGQSYDIYVTAKDAEGNLQIVPTKVTVTMKAAPTLNTVDTLGGATEDSPYTITYEALTTAADENDADGDTISFRIEAVQSGALTKGGAPVSAGNTLLSDGESLVWTPESEASGTLDAFTIKAWDGSSASADAVQVEVEVAAVDDAPTLSTVNTFAGATEDTPYTITYAALADASNEADVDSDTINFRIEAVQSGTLTKSGAPISAGSTLVSADESLVWTPEANANGTLNAFTIRAHDGSSASEDAVQVKVNVTGVSDIPTLTAVDTLEGATEDTPYTITYAALAAAANENDVDGDAISFRVEAVSSSTLTKDGGAVIEGTTLLSAGDSFVWTPAAEASGTLDAFTVKAWDGSSASADAVQVKIAVADVDDAPTLSTVNTFAGATEDTPYTITYTALVDAADEADIDSGAISFRIEGVQSGALTKGGALVSAGNTLLSDGESLVWTPESETSGTLDAFTIKAWDGSSASADAVQVKVEVADVDDAPTLTTVDTLAGAIEDTPYTITYAALADAADENDGDGDDISFRVEALSSGTLTKDGLDVTEGSTLLSSGESLVWIATADANGNLNAFTVKAWDGSSASADAVQVKVDVTTVNDAPTVDEVNNMSFKVNAGEQTIELTGISSGGNENQNLDVSVVSDNTAVVPTPTVNYTRSNPTGSLTFTPKISGTATITVTITDDGGTANGGVDTKTRTFVVTVQEETSSSSSSSNTNSVISSSVKTSDDRILSDNLASPSGNARIYVGARTNPVAKVSTGVVDTLNQNSKPLTIAGKGVELEFSPTSLLTEDVKEALQENKGTLEIGAKEVSTSEKEEILNQASLGQSTGLFEVGGKMVDLSAKLNTTSGSEKIESFSEPVAVTIDLSDLGELSQAQIAELTGVRFEKNDKGEVVTVKLGGKYDPDTKAFTFYTDKFSLYGVLRAESLVKINLTIDSVISSMNDIQKTLDVSPTLINNRTMVPIRFISEAFGAEVDWLGETSTVEIKLKEKELKLVIGETGPGLDVPATILNRRTMVPLRYVSENLGAYVKWFPSSRSIEIVK